MIKQPQFEVRKITCTRSHVLMVIDEAGLGRGSLSGAATGDPS